MDQTQIDVLVDALADRLSEQLLPRLVDRVIEQIAGYDDEAEGFEGDDADAMPGAPEDLGGEQMSAGMAFLPGMEGGDAPDAEGYGDDAEGGEPFEDDFDDVEDEPEAPDLGDEGAGDDDLGDVEDEPEDEDEDEPEGDDEEDDTPPGDEDDEQYMAGDAMIRGKARTARHDGHCDTKGSKMSKKSQYQSARGDNVVLERYGSDATLVRYQDALNATEAKNRKLAAELAKVTKKLERYASHTNQLTAELVRRDRADVFQALQHEGYELDLGDELAQVERYSNDEFDAHVERIRKNYRQTIAEDDFVPTRDPSRTLDPDGDDRSINPYEIARYAAEHAEDLRGLSPEEKARRAIEGSRKDRVRG